MKFKIRFADQIVGFFVIFSLAALAFVIVMLGKSQRWFSRDITFNTTLPSAVGLSRNMAVQFRGFTIGSVKSFQLNKADEVEVEFVINEEYKDRVRMGSIVDLVVSPVGLGNQFQFYPGTGGPLDEGSFVPVLGSAQARELIRQGLAIEPQRDDSISLLMARVNSLLALLNEALGPGSDITEIGKIVGSIQTTLTGAEDLPQSIDRMINGIQRELNSILANVNSITAELNKPDGLLYSLLDTDKELYTNLVKSLNSVSSMLDSLDKTTAVLPSQLPQISGLIMDLRATMKSVDDVLVALANNPLLKGGVPNRLETQAGNLNPRGIQF
jgi:phospholipid/cholesterol/gamma-HCH transport system substrate-binding protein